MELICLTLPNRPERWHLAEQEFKKYGLNVSKFFAVQDADRFKSFNLSQKLILESITEPTLVFEDDVILKYDFREVLNTLPTDWDMFYLGANVLEDLSRVNDNWWRCLNAWTTHAVGYSVEGAKKILGLYDADGIIYDEQLRVTILPQVKAYICKPFAAVQRVGYSDLMLSDVDYEALFIHAENRLK